ncbi:MAG TPA: diguanylate cyclase [Clostridiales bacterium]|nr:diguanylate cyclase [Clostridiales bacterium]
MFGTVLYRSAHYKNVVIVPIEKETRKVIGGIGIAMVNEKEAYESVFKKADAALYKAKGYNKPHVIIYDEAKNGL